MSGELLKKYMGRGGENDVDGAAGTDESEDFVVFGWLRGARERAVSLELRRRTGNILAIGYGWIERLEFNPSEGIILHCGKQTIKVKGRNLNGDMRPQVRLFEGICRHRVPFIAEADQAAILQAGKNAIIIESIEW
ncbi:MAG: hypothetical protein M3O30_18335 [Planctomycetota bacterium]|nr:hypothetical protein [Planctomycetota bacterium]